jgi:hypothetical protein
VVVKAREQYLIKTIDLHIQITNKTVSSIEARGSIYFLHTSVKYPLSTELGPNCTLGSLSTHMEEVASLN